MSRSDPSMGIKRTLSTPFFSRTLKILVFLILVHGFPGLEFSRIHRWDDGKLQQMFGFVSEVLGPGRAQASTIQPQPCRLFLDLSARAKPTKVQLTWTNQPGMIRYDILRATESDPFSFEKIGETTSTYSTYLDQSVSNQITYLYKINIVFPNAVDYSEVVSAHVPLSTRVVQIYNPVIYSEPVTNGSPYSPYTYTVQATDPNGYTLSYSLAEAPSGMAIDSTGGTITWMPPPTGGSFPVKVEADDGKGGTAFQEFTIGVQEVPPTAIIAGNWYQVAHVGTPLQLDGTGSTDVNGAPLSYQWSLRVKPAGSGSSLSDPTSATPTFVPDLPGDYYIYLYVNDGVSNGGPAEVQVHVPGPPPQAAISANPTSIMAGGSSTLSWSCTNADGCAMASTSNPDNTMVSMSGTLVVSPSQTTTYAIGAFSPDYPTAVASVTVTVIYPPTVSLSANPQTIQTGQSATLGWTSAYADIVTIDQGIGNVGANGSLPVSPTKTTTYTITAVGPGGTVTSSASITVTYPAPTVSISANSQTIQAGQPATLAWSSTNADTATIDQGIGNVSANGSLSVSPTQTTTYTITATGHGGTVTSSTSVTVTNPAPTATISANPQSIQAGQSATLTWNSTNANTAVIDNGIGSVAASGSMTVSPAADTTYTITVTGPGGTASASVLVSVIWLQPTVSLSANPASIAPGQSTTLTWTSTYAQSATIDQGIGSVALSGSMSITPSQNTTYTITVTGPAGTATASATVNVTTISLQITSPLDGSYVNAPFVMVQGTVANSAAKETGVTVNGVIAQVYGNQFVANHVPLADGQGTITASATDVAGYTAAAAITVTSSAAAGYVMVRPNFESGMPGVQVTLNVSGSSSISQSTISCSNPDGVQYLQSSAQQYTVTLDAEGIYFFTVQATDIQNNNYSDTVAILVWDQAQLDALLQAKWGSMRAKLAMSDIQGALQFFMTGEPQIKYEQIFNFIQANVPGGIAADAPNLPDPLFIKMDGEMPLYILARQEDGRMVEYALYFGADDDGLWKILRY